MADRESTHPPTKADHFEAKDLDRRFAEALSRKDLDAAMACFWNDPDLIVVLDGNVHRGPAAVRNGIKELFDSSESISMEVNEVTYVESVDGVIGVGTATLDLKHVGGPRQLMVERWSDLRRKIDGHWVYVLDHTTMVPK